MRMRVWIVLIPVAAIVLVAGVLPAGAQPPDDVSADRVNEIARNLYCPLCPGLTVDVCELQVCDDMKAVIAQQLAEGKSEEEIRQYFFELYGPKAVGAPEKRGSGLIAWLLPGLFAVAAVSAGVWWLRGRDTEQARAVTEDSTTTHDDAYDAWLERELSRMERE